MWAFHLREPRLAGEGAVVLQEEEGEWRASVGVEVAAGAEEGGAGVRRGMPGSGSVQP
jgi:hypothetical protein